MTAPESGTSPVYGGTVTDAGGGVFVVMVDRDAEDYPPIDARTATVVGVTADELRRRIAPNARWIQEARIVMDSWEACFDALPPEVIERSVGKLKWVAVLEYLMKRDDR